MIERLKIQGFRMLRDVDVPLRPLTVLLGENNSGKSSFLRALLWESEAWTWKPSLAWQFNNLAQIRFEVSVRRGGHHALAAFSVNLNGAVIERSEGDVLAVVGPELRNAALFELPRTGPVLRGEALQDTAGSPAMDEDGSTIPALLDHYLRKDRKRFDRVVDAAREHIDGLKDLHLDALSGSTRAVELEIENGLRLPANDASAGVRTMLFFLVLAHHPTPPSVVMIEEPETGLHPHRMADVMQILRGMTTGAFGAPPVQVLVTTHSPYLLDSVDLAKDQVLVFRRGPDGAALVAPADAERLKSYLGEFLLGEVWYANEETGLIAREGERGGEDVVS